MWEGFGTNPVPYLHRILLVPSLAFSTSFLAMDKPEYSTVRLALAHHTTLARQRNATTFLWSSERLICCPYIISTRFVLIRVLTVTSSNVGFNHETFGPISVDTLLTFIKCCTSPVPPDDYQGYRLAMAHVI